MALKLEREKHVLEIRNLHACVQGKAVLKGVNLQVESGQIHALMGPNGSGKTTLSSVILGHPDFSIEKGDILLDGRSILELPVEERSRKGLFLAFQYPLEIPGVSVSNFLRSAYNEGLPKEKKMGAFAFQKLLLSRMEELKMPGTFAERYVNDGFSGGEKKRCEILQMSVLRPHIAILDETDSGLDVDALRVVAQGTRKLVEDEHMGALIITHYPRILHHVKPDFVHMFVDGKIVRSGGMELAEELEQKGYGTLEPAPA